MNIPIIYEDEFLLVVDKPGGIVVNRAESVKEETLQDWAARKLQITNYKLQIDRNNDFYNRAGIVHRLDKETSGLVVIAKTPQVFLDLQAQFKDRKVSKKYITLVHGKVLPQEGEIRASVGRLPWNRERFGILPGGREAVTAYKVMAYYSHHPEFISGSGMLKQVQHDNYSLLDVTPHTGRTHQIRIHLKYLGHPVVADSFYAGRKTARADMKFCPRLFLHASYIAFTHPKLKKSIELISEMPKDLQKVLVMLVKNV